MKITIRNGVFETNSSSTHSFTVVTDEDKKERKQRHEQKLAQCYQKEQDGKLDKFSMYVELEKIEREFLECYSSFEIKLPNNKLDWFKDIKEYAEEIEEQFEWDTISDEDMKKVLIKKLKTITGEEYSSDYSVKMLLWKLWQVDPCYNEIVKQYLQLKDISYYYIFLKLEVEYMYEAMINECGNPGNIKIEENSKKLNYGQSLKMWAEELYKQDNNFKQFADDRNLTDFLISIKEYIKFILEERSKKCDKKINTIYCAGSGSIDYCNRDYEELASIYLTLKGIMDKVSKSENKNLSYAEFAKEFLSDKYKVYWIEKFNC